MGLQGCRRYDILPEIVQGGIAVEPVYYTVDAIDGDYARVTSDSGVENLVAMFLLPEGTTAGSRLVREVLEWRLLS